MGERRASTEWCRKLLPLTVSVRRWGNSVLLSDWLVAVVSRFFLFCFPMGHNVRRLAESLARLTRASRRQREVIASVPRSLLIIPSGDERMRDAIG